MLWLTFCDVVSVVNAVVNFVNAVVNVVNDVVNVVNDVVNVVNDVVDLVNFTVVSSVLMVVLGSLPQLLLFRYYY